MGSGHSYVRTRLSVMMFLEFFVWASWFVPVGGYITGTLQFSGDQIGWIFATTALGAIIAPLFVGYVADRLFSTERVLCVLHIIGGICLCLAAEQERFPLLMTLLMINGLCFMPTLALANSLAFRNIDDPDTFPRIIVWGTIGWIVSGLIVGFVLGESFKWFFYLAGGGGILTGLYCLSLPHTPPKGREETGGDVLGLGAIGLLKDPSFLVFAVSAFLICIPVTFYFVACNAFLVETGRPVPTALMTLAQFSEIFVMFTMPWFIAKIGLRKILGLGMLAWAVRYLCFGTLSFPLIVLALLLHGFCYCFVFVGAYIYVDKKAPSDLRASAQSLISFLMLGLGMFLGSKLGGYTMAQYPPLAPTAEPAVVEVIDKDNDGRVTLAELDQVPVEGLTLGDKTYAKTDLIEVFTKIGHPKADLAVAPDREISVTRADCVEARAHQWPPIWFWPAGAAAVIAAFFWLGSRDEQTADEVEEQSEEKGEE